MQSPANIKPAVESTDPRYVQWIAEWRKTNRQKNNCYSGAHAAHEAFPELRLVRGWAHFRYNLSWQKDYPCWDEHWWCEAPDGTVVDPTGEQWLDDRGGKVIGYEEYDPERHGPEPIGKCMCCGLLIYPGDYEDSTSFCSEDCEKETRAYYRL